MRNRIRGAKPMQIRILLITYEGMKAFLKGRIPDFLILANRVHENPDPDPQ